MDPRNEDREDPDPRRIAGEITMCGEYVNVEYLKLFQPITSMKEVNDYLETHPEGNSP